MEQEKQKILHRSRVQVNASGGAVLGRHAYTSFLQWLFSARSDEIICLALVASIAFGMYVSAAAVICVAVYALINPRTNQMLRSHTMFVPTMIMLAVYEVPALARFAKFVFTGRDYMAMQTAQVSVLRGLFFWLVMVAALYLMCCMTKRIYALMLDAVLVVSVISFAVAVFERVILSTARAELLYVNPNFYGYCIELFALVAVYRYIETRRLGYLGVLGLNIAGIVLCDCRTAWLALAASLMVFLLLRRSSRKYIFAFIGACALFVLLVQVVPDISPRLYPSELERAFGSRIRMWETAAAWIGGNPIIGYGTHSYQVLSLQYGVRHLVHAHNLVLNTLLDYGIIGTAFFVFYFGKFLSQLNIRRALFNDGMNSLSICAMVATFVHGLTDVTVLSTSTAVLFTIVLSGYACDRAELQPVAQLKEKLAVGKTM